MEKKRKCIFAGSFDPPTLGHKTVIENCLQIFDEVVVAILVNPQKNSYFTTQQKEEMLRLTVENADNLKIIAFNGTIAKLLEEEDTPFYVRGIRNSIDLAFENDNFYASKKLNVNLCPIYIPCPQELLHVSSSMVRNSLKFNTPIDEYVTEEVKDYILKLQR